MTTKLFLMCVTAASAACTCVAMPTEAEVEKAVPKVERMLASEKVALESGKMTRAEVAAAAMKLAAETDDEAAKLLLMKGAFILHVKDGDLEKAVKTMNTLETAIADMPPQVVTNIIETALLGLSNKAAHGARLYRLLDEAKVSAKSAVVEGKSLKAVVGGHTWSYSIRNGGASIEAPGGKYECAVSPTPEGSIVIPSKLGGVSVTRIGRAAFSRCHALTDVTIPPTVTSIGMSAFYECRMKSVTIPPAVKEIGELAFYNSSLRSVTIPEGVTSIGDEAFGDCWSLESVSIPSSVTSIGKNAVASGSNQLKSIDVSLDNPKYAVYGDLLCTKDGKTVLGSVGGEVKIPDGVTCIAESAFCKCYGLTSVAIPSSVVEIGGSAFDWCDDIYSFDVASENREFASPNGLLCTKDGKTVIAGVNGDIVIPEGVTRIGDSAFTGRRGLTSVTMPSSVRSLGSEVFRCCKGLESVTMRGEKPNAQKGLFDYCDKLKAIHVPVNAKSWSGMKNWFGIRLVFDVSADDVKALENKDRTTVQSIIDGMIKVPGKDCWLSETELTQGQWESVMGDNPSEHKGATFPVERVSRNDCDVFLEKLNQTKEVLESGFEFRLPELEEWKYAAWAGSAGNGSWIKPGVVGNVLDMAWVKENSSNETHAVAIKAPNAFGFYDMMGNVWEWLTGDAPDGARGALKGCAFSQDADKCTWNKNLYISKIHRPADCGLRLAAHKKTLPRRPLLGGLRRPEAVSNGLLGGSLRARRLQRRLEAEAAAAKQREEQAVKDAERQVQAEQERRRREAERAEERQRLLAIQDELKRMKEAKASSAKSECAANCAANKPVSEKSSVAEKLGQCDFLLNKDFKKNAKYYFYLLSDYWRSEMPRIAKTYAEMLKDDPGIELIHVLYGRDYEKALAWAKEHDVKFPIVKDNPLRLYWRTSGDYMFIVNADGSVLKEGQPKILFTEEKLRRLKNGEPLSNAATINGVKWTYEIVDDAIVLGEGTSRGGLAVPKNTVGDITIPETIDGNPVRGIGEYAFAGCSGLTSITIPSNVTKIANTAFEGCRGLTSISIPSSVRKIDAGVFNGCANLKSISVSAENEQYASCDGVLFDKGLQTLVCYPCGICGVYSIPEGVMCIGRSAFSAWASRYSGLSGVKIPDSVKSVGDYAFDHCQRLTEVILGNGVTTIGSCAFRDCDGLTSIKIPRSVVNIDHSAFIFCSGLKEFIVDPSNQKFTATNGLLLSKDGSELLAGIDGDVIVPEGVKSVELQAFCQYSGLTSVKLPSTLTDIGDFSFYSCVAMTSITIPANVKSIGRSAFGRCRSLTSVTMCGERPESPDDVFSSCDELKSIHVPANAKSWAGMKEWQGIPLVFDAK